MTAAARINTLLNLTIEELQGLGFDGILRAAETLREFTVSEIRQAIRDDDRLVYVGEYCRSKKACIGYIAKRLSERLQSHQRCSFA